MGLLGKLRTAAFVVVGVAVFGPMVLAALAGGDGCCEEI